MADPLTRLAALTPPARIDATVRVEHWRLHKPFVIARGAEHEIALVVVELTDGAAVGRGECCPVSHYGETVHGVVATTESLLARLRSGEAWAVIHDGAPAGAARNAVDCALWDLAAKRAGRPIHDLLGRPAPRPVETVLTIGVAAPEAMAAAAEAAFDHGLFKLKLCGDGCDVQRVQAVRRAAPAKRLIADANESWTSDLLAADLPALAEAGLMMLEQPLPAGGDSGIGAVPHAVPLGADESCHVAADLARVAPLYDVVNIKLDKTGGLTEALRLLEGARAAGLQAMVGCMLGTSLAMAPALLIAPECAFVDLDAPLLIGSDRPAALNYAAGWIDPADRALWG
jgi:L-alanine-DL-glutamate epimerase-like enolase superfamily enzyme